MPGAEYFGLDEVAGLEGKFAANGDRQGQNGRIVRPGDFSYVDHGNPYYRYRHGGARGGVGDFEM